MNEGWLWLSILKTTASPSPISMTPAFSPGPQITRLPVVGRVRSQIFEDLYEQCSLHITEKMPSSVRFGTRPRIATARSNSSPVSPCSAARAGVTLLPRVTSPPNQDYPCFPPPPPPGESPLRPPGGRGTHAAGVGGEVGRRESLWNPRPPERPQAHATAGSFLGRVPCDQASHPLRGVVR